MPPPCCSQPASQLPECGAARDAGAQWRTFRPCIASPAAGIMTILKTDNNPGLQVYYQGAFQCLEGRCA